MEGVEVVDGLLLRVNKILQCQRREDIKVATVRVDEIDFANESNFTQNIFALITLVYSPIDNGNGEAILMLKENHHRHVEYSIDLAGDGGEFATCIVSAFELNGDKNV